MATTKTYNLIEFQRILRKNGFVYDSSKGDHLKYKKGKRLIIISKKPNKMILQRLVKENNLIV